MHMPVYAYGSETVWSRHCQGSATPDAHEVEYRGACLPYSMRRTPHSRRLPRRTFCVLCVLVRLGRMLAVRRWHLTG